MTNIEQGLTKLINERKHADLMLQYLSMNGIDARQDLVDSYERLTIKIDELTDIIESQVA